MTRQYAVTVVHSDFSTTYMTVQRRNMRGTVTNLLDKLDSGVIIVFKVRKRLTKGK